MAGKIRIYARIAALCVWTFGIYSIRIITMFLTCWFPHVDHFWRRNTFQCWAIVTARILGMQITARGTPPKRPYFLVSNHLTYMDGLVLASQLGGVFLAKSEIASWPVIGFLAKHVNVIFVVREKKADTVRVNQCIKEAMDMGDGVVMFAEATTSRGTDVQPFKTALFEPAVQLQFPVYYATIRYSAPAGKPPASEWITWWEEISFGEHFVRMLRHGCFDAEIIFGPEPIAGTDRKALADAVHDAVAAQFVPID